MLQSVVQRQISEGNDDSLAHAPLIEGLRELSISREPEISERGQRAANKILISN